jgi:molecular chaperone DnaK (HSP70)
MELYSELMPPNTPIPYTFASDDYTLLRVDQDEMVVDVVQDLTGNAVYPEDTVPTGASGVLQGIPASETGEPHQIRFEFSYDVNGIVTLHAYVLATGQKLTIKLNTKDDLTDSMDKEETLVNINDLWNKSPLAPANAGIVRRAELVLSQSPSNMTKIIEALAELKTKISMNDRAGVLEARNLLIELLADSEV